MFFLPSSELENTRNLNDIISDLRIVVQDLERLAAEKAARATALQDESDRLAVEIKELDLIVEEANNTAYFLNTLLETLDNEA